MILKSLWAKFGICLTIFKKNFIHRNKKDKDRLNRQYSYIQRDKLKEEHKEWLYETLDHFQGKYFTIKSLHEKLVNENQKIRTVIPSILGRILKKWRKEQL